VFATWINDIGEIVGFGVDKATGNIHGFLASPAKAGPQIKSAAMIPMQIRPTLQRQMGWGQMRNRFRRVR
jgi:hypothetical protein